MLANPLKLTSSAKIQRSNSHITSSCVLVNVLLLANISLPKFEPPTTPITCTPSTIIIMIVHYYQLVCVHTLRKMHYNSEVKASLHVGITSAVPCTSSMVTFVANSPSTNSRQMLMAERSSLAVYEG